MSSCVMGHIKSSDGFMGFLLGGGGPLGGCGSFFLWGIMFCGLFFLLFGFLVRNLDACCQYILNDERDAEGF